MQCCCLRWAVNVARWEPDGEQWAKALRSVQAEEMQRINGFVYRDDAKAALIGRLLLRRAAVEAFERLGLRISWKNLHFERTEKRKPILAKFGDEENACKVPFSLNVSHHGDYAVLALNTGYNSQCGIDVMKIEPRSSGKTVTEYLTLMKKQFSEQEYSSMMRLENDADKMAQFYRYWCLKESYVKALGVGIINKLNCLDFRLANASLKSESTTTNTTLTLLPNSTNQRAPSRADYFFEESLLGVDHVVAVCSGLPNVESCCFEHYSKASKIFDLIDADFLLEKAENVSEISDFDSRAFFLKPNRKL